MKKLFQAAAIAAVLSLLGACAALQEGNADAKLITQYAVIKVAENDPAKADRIEQIALEVQKYAGDEVQLTVDALIVAIRAQIHWDQLGTGDTLLVNALLDRLRTELTARLGPDVLPEDLRLAVDTVTAWVIEACELV